MRCALVWGDGLGRGLGLGEGEVTVEGLGDAAGLGDGELGGLGVDPPVEGGVTGPHAPKRTAIATAIPTPSAAPPSLSAPRAFID